jgi:hypothetical protein
MYGTLLGTVKSPGRRGRYLGSRPAASRISAEVCKEGCSTEEHAARTPTTSNVCVRKLNRVHECCSGERSAGQ